MRRLPARKISPTSLLKVAARHLRSKKEPTRKNSGPSSAIVQKCLKYTKERNFAFGMPPSTYLCMIRFVGYKFTTLAPTKREARVQDLKYNCRGRLQLINPH